MLNLSQTTSGIIRSSYYIAYVTNGGIMSREIMPFIHFWVSIGQCMEYVDSLLQGLPSWLWFMFLTLWLAVPETFLWTKPRRWSRGEFLIFCIHLWSSVICSVQEWRWRRWRQVWLLSHDTTQCDHPKWHVKVEFSGDWVPERSRWHLSDS